MQYQPINVCSEREGRRNAIFLFLLGLFSQTQISIGGKLGISELVMVACAPFLFLKNIPVFRREHALTYFWLILLWLAGAIFVDVYTHNYFILAMRGIAVPITVFANSVCVYVLLRKKLDNLKWLLFGMAISGVVSIFVFQRGGAGDIAAEYGMEAGVERVVGYKLFWVVQLTTWLSLPIVANYLKCPKWYALSATGFLAVFNLVTGGRSMFFSALVTLLLLALGGKTRESIFSIKRHFIIMGLFLAVIGYGAKVVYEYAAEHGYMGEDEEVKHEKQSAHGSGLLQLLMAGRSDTFIGLSAALDKPIMGHGSVAIDDHGYVLDFLSKYGTEKDFRMVQSNREKNGAYRILAHSHIICYWMWHGIFGLLFWAYVIWLASVTIMRRLHIYPSWFGYFAVILPMFYWDVFFSPFGKRVEYAALFVTFLLISQLERQQKASWPAIAATNG